MTGRIYAEAEAVKSIGDGFILLMSRYSAHLSY